MIKLKDISVTFNQGTPLENKVLKNLNLEIEEGDFVMIIGGNGAGKSTLMNVLAGEVIPDDGHLLIDNKDVVKLKTEQRAHLVSRVFQDPMIGTCADLTIEENLALAYKRGARRQLTPMLDTQKRKLFREILAELDIGLEDRLTDPMALLSGGQRQAVSLVMATMKPSKILLLDEHTAALDPKMAKKVMEITTKLIQKHKFTTLMITHSMHQALEYGSRTILLRAGSVQKNITGDERVRTKHTDLLELFEEE